MTSKGINVLSIFDGMSCGQIALEKAGIKVDNYFASEIDKHAIKVAQDNYPKTIQLGDVNTIDYKNKELLFNNSKFGARIDIDLLIAGSPCQGFSFAGNQLNFNDDRSKLYFKFEELLEKISPKYFLLENVPMKKEYEDVITTRLGVSPIVINSSLVSAQNRKRLYWTNIPDISQPEDKNITLPKLLGNKYMGVYTIPRGWNKGGVKERDKSPTLTISSWQHNFFWVDSKGNHNKFSIDICEELQTVPVGYTSEASENQRYKMLGNGWTVDVIAHIFKGMNFD